MSINTAHAAGGHGVIIYNSERILIFYDSCELLTNAEIGVHPQLIGCKKGSVYLTSHRVIFINKSQTDQLQSLSMPFIKMRRVEVMKPIFGGNYITGNLLIDTCTNETGYSFDKTLDVHWSLTLKNGGNFEFGEALREAGKRAFKNTTTFSMPPAPEFGSYFSPPDPKHYSQAPPETYASIYQDPYYSSFVPQHASFGTPPKNEVFLMNALPPYPGMQEGPPQYEQQDPATNNSSQDPHQIHPSAPPAYDETISSKIG